MHKNLKTEMRVISEALKSAGFRSLESQEGGPMGSEYRTYRLDHLEIRLLNDRGDLSLDFRKSGTTEWFDLDLLRDADPGSSRHLAPAESINFVVTNAKPLQVELRDHYDRLVGKMRERQLLRTTSLTEKFKGA